MKKVLIFIVVCLLCCAIIVPISASASVADDVPSPYTVWRDDFVPWGYATILMHSTSGEYYLYLSIRSPVFYPDEGYLYFDSGYAIYSLVDGQWGNYNEYISGSARVNNAVWRWSSADIYDNNALVAFLHDSTVFSAPDNDTPTDDEDKTLIESILGPIGDWFYNLGESIRGTTLEVVNTGVQTILNGVKDLFIPDEEVLIDSLMDFADRLEVVFKIDTSYFENLFKNDAPLVDIDGEIEVAGIGKINAKFLDTELLYDGLYALRPIVRGFISILIILYHIRQVISFFGYNAGVVGGRNESIKSMMEGQK